MTKNLFKLLSAIKKMNEINDSIFDDILIQYSTDKEEYESFSNLLDINYEEFQDLSEIKTIFENRKRDYFTISSKETFNNLLLENTSENFEKSIIYHPLNTHSRKFLKKGDVLFCYRQGQFSSLDEALNKRGIYAIGFAATDPIEMFKDEEKEHEKYGIVVSFPRFLSKHLKLKNIQMHPNTINLTPYNGNRNDALQHIPSSTHYNTLISLIMESNSEMKEDFECILETKIKSDILPEYKWKENKVIDLKVSNMDLPHNRIVYGAPGTGKSYQLNKEVKVDFGEKIDRVTFYDGYTHGQFVGTYKPVPEGDTITYKYIPGPFMKQLVESYKNPTHNFCLIIEEINRAKADRVFGNIFQLLDRDSSGKSEYHIAVSEDQETYLREELGDEYNDTLENLLKEGLYIPNNLYIWATMNSADQGIYPMDSAFKRRWHFEHIGLDQNEEKFGEKEKNYKLTYQKGSEVEGTENKNILWNEFRKIINENLLKNKVSEDRLLAPFFIKENDFQLKDEDLYELDMKIFKNKILMYLFDDVLRHKRKNILFNENIESFSKLKSKYKNGENIFKNDLFPTEA